MKYVESCQAANEAVWAESWSVIVQREMCSLVRERRDPRGDPHVAT